MQLDSIAPVVAFHGHVTRLSAAGLPMDLGICMDGAAATMPTIKDSIERVEEALRLRVGLGQSLVDAIAAAPELASRHRAALSTWLASDGSTAALDLLTHAAQDRAVLNRRFGVSLIQPFLLMLLTFAAFALLCSTSVPRLEGIYLQLWKKPPGVLAWLLVVRDAMPIWIVAVPICLLALAWFCFARGATVSRWLWIPGAKRYLDSLRHAAFADQVATLLDQGMTVDRSMLLVDADLTASLKDNSGGNQPLIGSDKSLMKWAMSGEVGDEPMGNVFRYFANCYRQAAEHQASGIRIILPAVLTTLVSGVLVFIFGISLFVPLVDLMHELVLPGVET